MCKSGSSSSKNDKACEAAVNSVGGADFFNLGDKNNAGCQTKTTSYFVDEEDDEEGRKLLILKVAKTFTKLTTQSR